MYRQGNHEKKIALEYSGQVTTFELPFYCEGPAVDSHGDIYCTNLMGGQVLRINKNGEADEWAKTACPNGQIILKNDDHLLCDSQLSTIRRFDRKGKFIKDEIKGWCAGKKIHVPNDLIADKNEGIYFTDSIRENGCVGYYGKNGEEYIIAEGLDYPNGLVLSPDERCLYVSESYRNRIVKISIDRNKPELSVFADLPSNRSGNEIDNLPDGLQIDKEGTIWVAHYGMGALQIVSKKGELLGTVETQIRLTSNLYFDDHVMLITGGRNEPGPGVLKVISKE